MTAAIVDTHSHIQVDRFADDREAVITRALQEGLSRIVVCGDDVPSSYAALALADTHEAVLPTAGIHPHEADSADPAALDAIRELARDPRCVAVGEIGLDFYRDHSRPEAQYRALEDQLAIAVETSQPVVIHSRAAEDAAVEPLRQYAARSPLAASGRPVGVMHCFGGTLEQARVFVDMGFVVSLACTITYPKNDELRSIAAELPLGALVVETDSPYLPPQRLRGKRNEPANVSAAVAALAEARSMAYEDVARESTANAARLFGVEIPSMAVLA